MGRAFLNEFKDFEQVINLTFMFCFKGQRSGGGSLKGQKLDLKLGLNLPDCPRSRKKRALNLAKNPPKFGQNLAIIWPNLSKIWPTARPDRKVGPEICPELELNLLQI